MTLFLGALLAIAFASGTDDEVLQRVHGRIAGAGLVAASCRGVIAGGPELGVASIGFEFQLTGVRRSAADRYTGKLSFALNEVVITMPAGISWPRMTRADGERAEALRRAIYHHEVGHLRVAEAVRDALNEHDPIVAPDPFALRAAADALGREGFDRFKREERGYDEMTAHGRKQRLAPGVLAGPDTIILCS